MLIIDNKWVTTEYRNQIQEAVTKRAHRQYFLGRHPHLRIEDYNKPLQPKHLQQPLFPGDSEWQQLLHIFKLLGTPHERTWPGVTKLRDWHEFPQWRPQDLARVFPTLEEDGLDLLRRMLQYDPSRRISAKEALRHPYFDDLGAPPGSDPAADRAKVDALENPELEARAAAIDAGENF